MKEEFVGLTAECQITRYGKLACKVEQIKNYSLVPKTIEPNVIIIRGCDGVYTEIHPNKIFFKGAFLPENVLKREFEENPDFVKQNNALNFYFYRGKLIIRSTDEYPCE
jgi:hypothetical protein